MPRLTALALTQRRQSLSRLLAPVTRGMDRRRIRCAPYALQAQPSRAQHNALINNAIELGAPPGMVIARPIDPDGDGCTVEVLSGWDRVQAYLHPDAYPHAAQVPLATITASDPDAAYYAIEHAQQEQAAAGYPPSPVDYALAATAALTHFSRQARQWTIQDLANALCIARPTLSNRLRLLNGLDPRVTSLLASGALKPECAKILLAEPLPERQYLLAQRAVSGQLSTRALYRLVHPGYEPPALVKRQRRDGHPRLGDVAAMERTLADTYGAPAHIAMDASDAAAGFVSLQFHSLSELKGILEKLDRTADTDTLFRGELAFTAAGADHGNRLLEELGATTPEP